jgi:hypothetical protein
MTADRFLHHLFAISATIVLASIGAANCFAAGIDQTCGGKTGVACDNGLFCDPKPGSCSNADAQGTCKQVPEICQQVYLPVCGCDNRKYSNDCARVMARVAKSHDGECK